MAAARSRTRSTQRRKQLAVQLGDRSLQLCLEGETTIASLKEILEAREGVPTFLQKLYRGNRLLQDWMSFGDGDETCDVTQQFNLALAIPGGAEQTMDQSGGGGRGENNINPAAGLPRNPRDWTPEHVATWVQRYAEKYNIDNLDLRRFHMNGKGLSLMSANGFNYRVPNRGEQMYRDFRNLL